MAVRKGLRAVREAKEQMNRSGNNNPFTFRLQSGESAVVRFFGDFEGEEDPAICDRHYVKRFERVSNLQAYQWCGDNNGRKCVYCHVKDAGDKGVSKSPIANFFIYDKRKSHKFEDKQKIVKTGRKPRPGRPLTDQDYYYTKYPMCIGGKRPCHFCKQGNEARPIGFRHWPLATMFAEHVVALQETIREYCKCGARDDSGEGTIVVRRYLCANPECGVELDFNPDLGQGVALCAQRSPGGSLVGCGQTLPPLEEIECTECDSPYRTDLQDWWVRVTRTGEKKTTGYNFETIPPCSPVDDDIYEEAVKRWPDWEKVTGGDPPEIQAQNLGIPNPFGGTSGHGSTGYDEPAQTTPEEEESYGGGEVDYGEPAKKKKKTKPPKAKRGIKFKLRK